MRTVLYCSSLARSVPMPRSLQRHRIQGLWDLPVILLVLQDVEVHPKELVQGTVTPMRPRWKTPSLLPARPLGHCLVAPTATLATGRTVLLFVEWVQVWLDFHLPLRWWAPNIIVPLSRVVGPLPSPEGHFQLWLLRLPPLH